MSSFLELISDDERIPFFWKDSIIYFRRLTNAEIDKIRKKWTVKKGKTRDGQPITETDDVEFEHEVFDQIVVDWTKVYQPRKSAQDEPVEAPCTREWKRKVPLDVRGELVNKAMSGEKEEERSQKKTSEPTPAT